MIPERPKVIVTGGAGYIGSHTVVSLWDGGYEPIIIDNFQRSYKGILPRLEQITSHHLRFFDVDCRNHAGMRKVFSECGDVLAVIHFAAFKAVGESVAQPAFYYDNNIGGLAVLLQVMEEFGNPGLVFSSSCTVYGQPEKLPVTEDTPILPAMSPYGFTKQACEQLLIDSSRSKSQLKSVSLRYFNPIGAHPSSLIGELPIGTPNNLVPFLTQAMAGLRPPLTVFGTDYPTPDGTCIRDYIHVMDLADAHVAALSRLNEMLNPAMEIYNIGSGSGHSVMEVIQNMESVTGQPIDYQLGPRRPGDVAAIFASSEKSLPGWKPVFSLSDSLRDAWNWQKALISNPVTADAKA